MALNLGSPLISRLSHPSQNLFKNSTIFPTTSGALFIIFLSRCSSEISALKHLRINSSSYKKNFKTRAYSNEKEDGDEEKEKEKIFSGLLDDELLRQVSSARDADQALEMIAEKTRRNGGIVGTADCCSIIMTALDRNNAELAFSVFSAMRSSFDQDVSEKGSTDERWKWARPDVRTYASLVRGLAALLRVSDAIRTIAAVSQMGISSGEEVPFGRIVRCPSCMIAIAVAQPQQGIQVASCSKCRYQYELVSGDIVSIESEEISTDISAWEKGLRFLQIMKQSIPAAVHSIVVRMPSGTARTHRFATKTVELPAQEGERVTITLAAPSNVYRDMGPFRFSAKAPGFRPGEPMSLINHSNGQESQLLRPPLKNGSSILLNPSILFPFLSVLAAGDAASGIIDPRLPQFISIVAVASVALGSTINGVVLPQLNKLPQKMVDVVAIKQQLLSQYDLLQTRIKDLSQVAEKEVWMLARMCQLENKIVAVGESSYSARRSRVKRVRESLENSLLARIELIDSYAKISSMIEIEVEMDSDVLAAEAVSNTESIAEQIQQIMDLENLEQRWKIQAEANDEVERLLSSQPMSTEAV
ncbi:uncharacterized protein LOC143890480 [Tasmannia lanceolata]|uniref:uncharacterized protein LOC143890480 n=1 Tax=Tasmannia lanceolata TaxID=3420 RepID=UPI0040639CB6